jgi:hypothetical protein
MWSSKVVNEKRKKEEEEGRGGGWRTEWIDTKDGPSRGWKSRERCAGDGEPSLAL